MMKSLTRILAMFAIAGVVLMPAAAMAVLPSQEDIVAMQYRLDLTPEQRDAITPILQDSMSARSSTFEEYGVDVETCERPGALGLIRLNKDMKRINAKTRSRLAEILTPAQLSEYDKIVAEQTAIVKEQILC
jgi:hypothetical protein